MPLRLVSRVLCFMLLSAARPAARAQTEAPSSGEVTVRLAEGLDSAQARPGAISHGSVVRSGVPAQVPLGTTAIVQLVPEATGGFSVHLAALSLGGRFVRTGSAGASLTGVGKLFGKLQGSTGGVQPAVAGPRVFLPGNTDVRFTLAPPPPRPEPRVAVATAPPPPSPPPPVTGAAGDFSAGPGLPTLHTEIKPFDRCHWVPYIAQKFGFAMLVMDCADPRMRAVFTETAKGISEGDGGNPGSGEVITVYTKPETQPIKPAIEAVIRPTLKPGQRLGCHPQLGTGSVAGAQDFSIGPTTPALKRIDAKAEPGDNAACDPWEIIDAAVGFVYLPETSKTHFFWVISGQEQPMFDVYSIRFLESK